MIGDAVMGGAVTEFVGCGTAVTGLAVTGLKLDTGAAVTGCAVMGGNGAAVTGLLVTINHFKYPMKSKTRKA